MKSKIIISTGDNRLNFGKGRHGRRCKIRVPFYDQIFSCQYCHNSAGSVASKPEDCHEIVRRDITQVICVVCDTEQQVGHICLNCGVNMGEYFCDICKFYDDDTSSKQVHCDDCGVCRVGGRENYFHCKKCGSCLPIIMQNNHSCVENSMKKKCPICCESLFYSIRSPYIMSCGHAMHIECYHEMLGNEYRCPLCSKTVADKDDMARRWKLLENDIAASAIPGRNHKKIDILCNDCNKTSKAPPHILGQKCGICKSYNSRVIVDKKSSVKTLFD